MNTTLAVRTASILLVLMSMMQCSTPKLLTVDHPTAISFGEFGGFAGAYIEYIWLPNGQVFQRKRFNAPFESMKTIDPKVYEQIVDVMHQEHFAKLDIQDSGNMSYFIRYKFKGQEKLHLVWGGNNVPVPSIVPQMYKNMKSLCKSDHPVM